MKGFNINCEFCTTANNCALGYTTCDDNCPDYCLDFDCMPRNDYSYDDYDYYDDYLDDLNDGEIPDDDDW